MQDVAVRMIGEMARNMEALLTPAPAGSSEQTAAQPPPEAKPIKGFSLMFGVLADRLRRLFSRSRS